jgi:tetraacyldisaccharide 4'-kinase
MIGVKSTFDRLRGRIMAVVKKKGPSPLFSLESVLLFLSIIYGAAMRIRARLYATGLLPSRGLPCRVISIGNITAGGTGKTPTTIYVAQHIRDMGYRVAVISRGYRGRLESVGGGVVSDGRTIFKDAEEAGDEAYLMARVLKGIPVVVGRRRYDAAMLAVNRFQPDVIVLDDAFQHLKLKRDVDLVLLDRHAPYGNGELLPRGTLREPASALQRADAIIFTRSETGSEVNARDRIWRGRCPEFYTHHCPVVRMIDSTKGTFLTSSKNISALKGQRVVAFAGLADNTQFFDTLRQSDCHLIQTIEYADHYRYDRRDLDRIAAEAKKLAAESVVTTLKDFVKIEALENLPMRLVVVDVVIQVIGEYARLHELILTANKRC